MNIFNKESFLTLCKLIFTLLFTYHLLPSYEDTLRLTWCNPFPKFASQRTFCLTAIEFFQNAEKSVSFHLMAGHESCLRKTFQLWVDKVNISSLKCMLFSDSFSKSLSRIDWLSVMGGGNYCLFVFVFCSVSFLISLLLGAEPTLLHCKISSWTIISSFTW